MATVFITGSTQVLGRGAALALLAEGHRVVLHARSRERAAALGDLGERASGVVVGGLSSERETRSIAEQVNAVGHMVPYLLTALIVRPSRALPGRTGRRTHPADGNDFPESVIG